MNRNWDKVTIEANLVSLPDIYWKLKQIIDSNDYAMMDLARLIGFDPGMTARLLRIVNSAYFGFASKIETVNHAVSILGVQQIQDLVLATSVADALGDYECEQLDIRKFWERSVYRAIAAKNIAGEYKMMDGERMFVAGLLSGIGHLIMYQSLPVLAQQANRESEESGQPLCLVEQQTMGFDHAQVAASLMSNWQLPVSLVEMIGNHLRPEPTSECYLETSIVHIAALMSQANDLELDAVLAPVDKRAWDFAGLEPEQCAQTHALVREQLGEVISMIFPSRRYATA